MPRLSQEKINEIRSSVDIVDVIGNYLPISKKGRNYVAVCPFHDDTNPSLSISPEKQIYRCFVCHNSGNVFTFLQEYLKIPFMEAVKEVAKMGNVDISEYEIHASKPKIDEKKEPLYLMHEEALKIYTYYLNTKSGLGAKEYLTDRHINKDVIEYFQIGYAPNNNLISKDLDKKGYSQLEKVKSGLVIESQNGYDRFSDRIMFPLFNSFGRIVGFSGRIYRKSQNESKYMNSPESDIFIKGETLYNYHRVKDAVRSAGCVIVCEGFMDVIALYKAGVKNAVAIMGTALTKGHVQLLKRLSKKIVMCLDGDHAGQNATLKCIDILENDGLDVSVVTLPGDQDPDEVLENKGKDELIACLSQPIKSIEFKMNFYFNDININNYDDRKHYMETMAQAIGKLKDQVDRDYYLGILSSRSQFAKETIETLISKEKKVVQPKPIQQVTYGQSRHLASKYIRSERNLLFYMMQDKKYADMFQKNAGFMIDKINHLIAMYIIDYYRQYPVLEIADLINGIDDENIVKSIVDISHEHLPKIDDDSIIKDYIDNIRINVSVEKRIEELRKMLEDTKDVMQQAKIASEIIELSNKKE